MGELYDGFSIMVLRGKVDPDLPASWGRSPEDSSCLRKSTAFPLIMAAKPPRDERRVQPAISLGPVVLDTLVARNSHRFKIFFCCVKVFRIMRKELV